MRPYRCERRCCKGRRRGRAHAQELYSQAGRKGRLSQKADPPACPLRAQSPAAPAPSRPVSPGPLRAVCLLMAALPFALASQRVPLIRPQALSRWRAPLHSHPQGPGQAAALRAESWRGHTVSSQCGMIALRIRFFCQDVDGTVYIFLCAAVCLWK